MDADDIEILKATLYCELCEKLKASSTTVDFSDEYLALLTETIYELTRLHCIDITSFAKHAKRQTAKPADVLLLARRNNEMLDILTQKATTINPQRRKC
ncbi:hypothetical protein GJ496_009235 [Pomphorhynchus laevis]|nr:hypothetical protein GJ496_009235 [Pomphorhynchus laevis]